MSTTGYTRPPSCRACRSRPAGLELGLGPSPGPRLPARAGACGAAGAEGPAAPAGPTRPPGARGMDGPGGRPGRGPPSGEAARPRRRPRPASPAPPAPRGAPRRRAGSGSRAAAARATSCRPRRASPGPRPAGPAAGGRARRRLLAGGALCAGPCLLGAASGRGGAPPGGAGAGAGADPRWAYQMTWPAWSTLAGGGKYVDYEVERDPACEDQPRWPIDWFVLRYRVAGCAVFLDAYRSRPLEAASAYTAISRGDAVWGSVQEAVNSDVRFSSHRNDCYLGALAFQLCEHLSNMQAVEETVWVQHWQKLQLELEALWFFMQVPWSVLIQGRWRLGALLNRLAHTVQSAGGGRRSLCDLADGPADTELLRHADPNGVLPAHVAEAFLTEHGQPGQWKQEFAGRCPFGVAAAVLSLALWIQSGAAAILGGGYFGGLSAEALVDLYMTPLFRVWEERTPQFFYDVLASHWRLWGLFEALDDARWAPTTPPPAPPAGARAETETETAAGPGVRAPRRGRGGRAPPRVLFLGGGGTTHRWTSFTQRGRQLARGLRALGPARGADARAWNAGCRAWCAARLERLERAGAWAPSVIVHVKYVCSCAVTGARRAVHIYDPVDINDWRDRLKLGSSLLRVDALLLTTSLALQDVRSHPALRAAGNVSAFWLPLHHSNFHGIARSEAQVGDVVEGVGVHTVHHDQGLRTLVQAALRELSGDAVRFVHLDPAALFRETEGRVMAPQQTRQLYQQIASLDVGIAKQSGCVRDWWFCSRWRTGQRLVNLVSAGVPAVVWGDAQGHLDAVEARWPPQGLHGDGSLPGPAREHYPKELVVDGDQHVRAALSALLRNASLRAAARRQGLRLAARFSLPRIAARLGQIIRWLLSRRASRTPSWRARARPRTARAARGGPAPGR